MIVLKRHERFRPPWKQQALRPGNGVGNGRPRHAMTAVAGGEPVEGSPSVADLIAARDWSQTPIGPTESWPPSLRTALSICLESRFPILIWWGPEFVMLYNDAYAPLIGSKHPAALGQRGADCFPEIWEIIGPMLAGVRERGESTWSEDQLLLLERSGFPEECYFTFSYSPIRNESDAIDGVFTAVAETTTHVIGARRLRILRELTAATAEARSPVDVCKRAAAVLRGSVSVAFSLFYLFDGDRSVARLAASSDLRQQAAVSPRVVTLSDDGGETAWPIAAVAEHGELEFVDDVARRVGDARAAQDLASRAAVLPLRREAAAPVGALVLGLNERRPADDDYLAFLALVARQVGTAIADAQHAEAERQRTEALAELDRAKTLFFTNVSHELRTPLTLILSPLEELLVEQGRPADRKEELELIRRNALRLLRLVNTLLDFSRAESGRIDALFQPTDLAAVTADLASAFRSAIEAAGLRLDVDCPPLDEPIWVDREAWEKIVLNLLSNALKFTFEGAIAVSLRLEDDDVVLRVRDTGVGVPEQELPHVFERFHRIRDVAARSHEGSGIGLALVNELARLHAGTVGVDSIPGVGSTFTVCVPRGSAHLPADRIGGPEGTAARSLGAAPYVEEALRWLPDEARPEPGAGAELLRDDLVRESGASRTSARILIVDDNADMRAYLARLLRRYWQVETVADGEAAVTAARLSLPDLVLSDVMMPRLDGFGLLRELRADARTSSIPVVLVSARAGTESAIEGLEAGADDYLVKPFSARELVARVRANLELARLRVDNAQLEATAAERARAERVLMTLPEGVFTIDPAGAVDVWNPAAAQITGLPAETVVGRPVEQALPGWHGIAPNLAARHGKPTTYPFGLGDREVWLSLVATPYAEGTLYAFRDATEAARLEQMRRDVITTVSHELRTPVSSIYGAVATLARDDVPLTDHTREQLIAMLHGETERLSRIVNDLITANSLGADDTRQPLHDCDLVALVERVLERARERCPDNLELRHRLPERTDRAALDEERLEQVLEALVDNAIRYSPNGGEIELAVERSDGTIRFGVRDTGIGIDARHHPHIGEKFYRADPEQHAGAAGLGLGLYICNQLASLMNGRLWFESAAGAGSTFFLELPEPPPARSHQGRASASDLATRA
jgi:PAS domain S-box-containing protein